MESRHLPLHQVGAGLPPDGVQQEGRLRKAATAPARHRLPRRMVHGTSHPHGHDAAKGGKLGGEGKVLESDETFVGGKAKTAHKNKPIPQKHAVHALVERGGEVRVKHVADVTPRRWAKC